MNRGSRVPAVYCKATGVKLGYYQAQCFHARPEIYTGYTEIDDIHEVFEIRQDV